MLRVNRVDGQDANYSTDQARQNVRQGQPWFNKAAFSQPVAFAFGNASRNIDELRRDGIRNTDLSLFKKFQIKEVASVEFRAEMFNAWNQVIFSAPQGSVTSTQFGLVTGTATSPRVIQFGLKVSF